VVGSPESAGAPVVLWLRPHTFRRSCPLLLLEPPLDMPRHCFLNSSSRLLRKECVAQCSRRRAAWPAAGRKGRQLGRVKGGAEAGRAPGPRQPQRFRARSQESGLARQKGEQARQAAGRPACTDPRGPGTARCATQMGAGALTELLSAQAEAQEGGWRLGTPTARGGRSWGLPLTLTAGVSGNGDRAPRKAGGRGAAGRHGCAKTLLSQSPDTEAFTRRPHQGLTQGRCH
jgi:hypothetical protein